MEGILAMSSKEADRQKIISQVETKALSVEEALQKAKELQVEFHPKIFSNGDTRKQLLARNRYFLFKPSSKC